MATPADPAAQLQTYLHGSEQLLWSGRPDPDVRFAPADVFLVPFSLVFGGLAAFWEISVVANGASLFFVLWGIPFVAVGAYMVFGRFLVKRARKLTTAYAVTDQRAISVIGDAVHDTPVAKVPRTIRRHRDGRHVSVSVGNTGLFKVTSFYGNTGLDFHPAYGGPVTFYDVADAEPLLAALDRARTPAGTTGF